MPIIEEAKCPVSDATLCTRPWSWDSLSGLGVEEVDFLARAQELAFLFLFFFFARSFIFGNAFDAIQ